MRQGTWTLDQEGTLMVIWPHPPILCAVTPSLRKVGGLTKAHKQPVAGTGLRLSASFTVWELYHLMDVFLFCSPEAWGSRAGAWPGVEPGFEEWASGLYSGWRDGFFKKTIKLKIQN